MVVVFWEGGLRRDTTDPFLEMKSEAVILLQAHMSENDQKCLAPSLMLLDTPYITTDRRTVPGCGQVRPHHPDRA